VAYDIIIGVSLENVKAYLKLNQYIYRRSLACSHDDAAKSNKLHAKSKTACNSCSHRRILQTVLFFDQHKNVGMSRKANGFRAFFFVWKKVFPYFPLP